MTAPTPWQANNPLPQPESESVRQLPSAGRLRETWPYAAAAVGSMAVFFMLFQTWMVTPNWSGFNSVDAFGTTHTTTTHINLWSREQPPGTAVSGVWGILATVAIFITVFAATQAIYRGTRTTGLVTSVASVAVALFVIIDLFYIRSKQVPVQVMTGMGNDLGAHLGLVVTALRGSGSYPWPGVPYVLQAAHMTSWAYGTAAVAFTSAGVAATRTWYNGGHGVVAAVRHLAGSARLRLSDELSRMPAAARQAGSATSDSDSAEPAGDRDWGAAG